jgi:hypothetical protein
MTSIVTDNPTIDSIVPAAHRTNKEIAISPRSGDPGELLAPRLDTLMLAAAQTCTCQV